MAAQYVRVALRQMELAPADIDPHVGGAGHHVRVAGQAEPGEVEIGGGLLVGNPKVDVFETDDVADILGLAVVLLLGLCHWALQSCRSAGAVSHCRRSAFVDAGHQNSFSNLSSTGTRYPLASLLVSFAMPTTARTSPRISGVIPARFAAAPCEAMQYVQPLLTLTAR